MHKQILGFAALFVFIGTNLLLPEIAYGYGSSGQRVICKKPIVKTLSPAPASGAIPVTAGSEFSFEVSNDAKQKAITLSAKDIDMPAQITTLPNGKFQVTGNLPESLTEGYASVVLTAPAGNGKCSGQGKVLVQIN